MLIRFIKIPFKWRQIIQIESKSRNFFDVSLPVMFLIIVTYKFYFSQAQGQKYGAPSKIKLVVGVSIFRNLRELLSDLVPQILQTREQWNMTATNIKKQTI